MSWWTKFGCMLTGWNADVLAECSEASRSQLSKYTSAMVILIMVWGVTGFCFAQRYIGLPYWACSFVSLFFITIVVMIERQIILTVGKNYWMAAFRVFIALIMAFIGSAIFDQTIFGKDIDKQMASNIEAQVEVLSKQRMHIIDDKLLSLKHDIDSMDVVNAQLQADVNKAPLISISGVKQLPVTYTDSKGSVQTKVKKVVESQEVENPKQKSLQNNIAIVQGLRSQEQSWLQKKQNVEDDTRKECTANVGFLEELEAMWTILSTKSVARVFYLIFFCLLMSLELFVVTSKFGDKECDYEATIKGSQTVRMKRLNVAFSKISA